jgi:hypothetical protein
MTRANHTTRAMIRKAPEKRVVATLETVDWLALFPSESDRFMHLSLIIWRGFEGQPSPNTNVHAMDEDIRTHHLSFLMGMFALKLR